MDNAGRSIECGQFDHYQYTAGYDPDPAAEPDVHTIDGASNQQPDSTVVLAVPQTIRTAILMLVADCMPPRTGSCRRVSNVPAT